MATKKDTATKDSGNVAMAPIEILRVEHGALEVCILGTSPYICNRMSEKGARTLLLPSGRKNAVEKATSLKHDPIAEFRGSPYRLADPKAETLIAALSTAFKGAMGTAALDLPGAKKTQVGRLVHVDGMYVALFGVPQLLMATVRSADINKTPDIRTRAILPQWACRLVVTFVRPLMHQQAVVNLLSAAGMTVGVGDWRPEKGKGNFGQFKIVSADDAQFRAVVKSGGRTAQLQALETPTCYDDESTELLSWYEGEIAQRKIRGVA